MKDKKDATRHFTLAGSQSQEASAVRINFVKKSKTIVITRRTCHRYFNNTSKAMLYVKIIFRDVDGKVKYEKAINGGSSFAEDDRLNSYPVKRSYKSLNCAWVYQVLCAINIARRGAG